MTLFLTMLLTAVAADLPSADDLLRSMDQNLQYETRTSVTRMEVVDSRRTRSYTMQSYARGASDGAMEYLAPEREKGTKMLKLGDELWLYMPRAERVQKISGHMMRQGMMGSDMSYEDMMASATFAEMYTAEVTGEAELDGRACWTLLAVARDDSVTYPKRQFWIDQEWLIPTRQELYALSGMLLKTWTMSEPVLVEGQWVPMRMVITDELKAGSKTVLVIESLEVGVALEDEVFSKRWLERR
jgi:outer membrane lipoprotein-sorting protein